MPKMSQEELLERVTPFATKIAFFQQHGYEPHYHQLVFHTAQNPETHLLARYRSLAAGRRGGKTLSAAEDVAYYMEFPEEFHLHAHGKIDDRSLHVYALTENYKRLLPAYRAFKDTLIKHGLKFGRDVKERIADKTFEFANGSLIEFRSADEPDSLRGAGLDILWMDEAAFIRSDDAYRVVRPALADKQGIVINTTTPDRQNWFYERFWSGDVLTNPRHFRVSYWSLDNPYFPVEEWEEEKADQHPFFFAQEYMASFDAMKGNALSADWLHYYSDEDIDGLDLEKYIGIDPAISQDPKADRFVLTVIGIHRATNQVYLLEQYADKIPFPDQVDAINRFWLENQPCMGVGVETVAYQAALAQQVVRLDNFIPVLDIQAKGKKHERILSMSPLFRAKRVLIRRTQKDFIDEWLSYDVEDKHPHDDCLDSMEIALRTAGVLLTPVEREDPIDHSQLARTMTSQEAADRRYQRLREARQGSDDRWAEFDYSL
jgi:predicted phage terminase large subunit-like protein